MSGIPKWFPAALAQATAEDYVNSLPEDTQLEIERHIEAHGNPPQWFMDELRKRGLNFKEKPGKEAP